MKSVRNPVSKTEELEPLSGHDLLNYNGASDLLKPVLPRVKVEYMVSEDVPPEFRRGWFTSSLSVQKQEIKAVLLCMRFSRIMWSEYTGQASSTPLCKSNDGLVSELGTQTYPEERGSCKQCPHSLWKTKTPPECSEVYSLLMLDLEDESPFVVPIKGASIISLRKLKTLFKLQAKKWGLAGFPINTSVALTMKARPVSNYYVIEFPQRNLKGNPLWEKLPLDKAKKYTKLAYSLASEFNDVDIQRVVDISDSVSSGEDSSKVPF